MKSATDPRHKKRIELVKELFADTFQNSTQSALVSQIVAQKDEIDKEIKKAAPAWPIEKINKIDLAILRLAVYEIKEGQTPTKVVIDEAVEIAKMYGSDNSGAFVNGVLGAIVNSETFGNGQN